MKAGMIFPMYYNNNNNNKHFIMKLTIAVSHSNVIKYKNITNQAQAQITGNTANYFSKYRRRFLFNWTGLDKVIKTSNEVRTFMLLIFC